MAALGLALLLAAGVAYELWSERSAVRAAVGEAVGVRRVESWAEDIHTAALESEVDPCLVAAIMYKESRGRVGVTSSRGALGLMQLATSAAGDAAKRIGVETPTKQQLLKDGALNIRLGAAHLAWLLEHKGEWSLEQVLIAYNAGRTKLFRWIRASGGYDAWRAEELRLMQIDERSTGTLAYALETIALRDRFEERGVIKTLAEVRADSDADRVEE
jgi:soluble lytic murein transglycosylase-like protein